jgi:hypothetical protein
MAHVGGRLVNDKVVFWYDMGNPNSFIGAPTINYMNTLHPRRDSSYTPYVANTSGEWANNHPDAIYVYSAQTDASITGFVNSGVTDWSNTDHCIWHYDVELDEPVITMRNYDGNYWKAFNGVHGLNLAAIGLTTGDYYVYSYDLWTTDLTYRPNPGLYSQNTTGTTAFWDGQGGLVTDNLPLAVGKWHRRWCSFQISANHDTTKGYTRWYWYGYQYASNQVMKIRRPQLELKTNVASAWTLNPRSNTEALLDITKNHTMNVANLVFSNNQIFSFSGSTGANAIIGDVATAYQASANSIPRSWEVVVYPTTSMSTAGIFGHVAGLGCSYFCNGGIAIYSNGNYRFVWYDDASYNFLDSGVSATANQYAHIVGTYSNLDFKCRIYVNGVLKATSSATNMKYNGSQVNFILGYFSALGYPFTGQIPIARWYYGKCLSDREVSNNFNALRTRFGL